MTTPGYSKKPFYKSLTVQVLFAMAIAVVLGYASPARAIAMKPLGDAFIRPITMIIALIIFCTVVTVTGIARLEDLKKVGRVGGKALLYFEVVSCPSPYCTQRDDANSFVKSEYTMRPDPEARYTNAPISVGDRALSTRFSTPATYIRMQFEEVDRARLGSSIVAVMQAAERLCSSCAKYSRVPRGLTRA